MTRRAVIGYPSFLSSVASVHSLTANSAFPVANLTDKIRVTNVWRSTAAGADWAYYTFPTTSTLVEAVFLVGHNLGAAATVRLRLFSTTTYDNTFGQPVVYDSGVMPAWPTGVSAVSGYRQVRPIILANPTPCGGLVLNVNTNDGSNAQIGALEVSGLWDLVGLGEGRQRGFDARTPVTIMAGGADSVPSMWLPRTFSGGVDMVQTTVTETTGMDFAFAQDLVNPFVFADDVDNPASWPRGCMLARNQKINAFSGASYRRDKLALNLIEHGR